MSNQLIKWLKSAYQNAWQELSKKPIATISALIGIIVLLLPLFLSEFLRETIWHLLSKILLLTIEVNILLLTITVLLLIFSFWFIQKEQRLRKKNYDFIFYQNFEWKIHNPYSPFRHVDFPPYCEAHKIQLLEKGIEFICPVCINKLTKNITYSQLRFFHIAVEKLATAIYEKHLKI